MNTIKFKIPVNIASAWREIVANHDCESVTDFVESLIIEIPITLYLVKERVDELISQLDLSSKCENLYIRINDRFAKRRIQELKKDNIDKNHFLIYCVYKATKETFPDYIKKINEFSFSLSSEDDKKDDREHPNVSYFILPGEDDKKDDRELPNVSYFILPGEDDKKDDTIPEGVQTSVNNKMETPNINVLNFREKVRNQVKKLFHLIEATENQKTHILEKAEDILNDLILRAKRGKMTIPKNSNPLTHAAAIIYAVTVSNENMPIFTGRGLAKLIETNLKTVNELYNKWYKDLAPKLNFNLQSAQLRSSRNVISLYIFELLLNTKTDLSELILHLRKKDTFKIVLHLREIITNANKEISRQLTLKEKNLLKLITTRKIETLQDMMDNYSDTFTKYFTDLVDIIKLLIISNKSHKIIGAVFSIAPFVEYLINKKINLFLTQRGFLDVIGDIFNFLKETEYSELFPARTRSKEDELYQIDETGKKRQLIASARIKIYVMKHFDGGKHFDLRSGVVICPDCLNEGFIINTSLPRIRSKEFHHKDSRLQGYTAIDLYNLFNENRGDPYFLQNLIKQMERESVVIKCGCHHNVIHDNYPHFNKFVNWKNIPKELPYKDIFDLPAEIIHIIAYICIEAFYQGKIGKRDIKEIKNRLIYKIKKRYIIDLLYGGVCPVCGEFNIIDHSRAIDYNHLYRLKDLTPEEREKRKKNKLINLYKKYSCSELVREMQKKYHKGGYVCHNCHTVIHTDLELVPKIYDDSNIIRKIREDKEDAFRKYKQNLIRSTELIKNPLESEIVKYKAFMKYLFAIFKIMEEKDEVSTVDLANEMGKNNVSTIRSFFRRRKNSLEKYGTIVFGDSNNPTRFYMSEEGKRIVHLLFFFKSYYENLSLSDEE